MDWISMIQSIKKVQLQNIRYTFEIIESTRGNRDVRSRYRYWVYDQ
jgi:hypothetical protein